MVKSVRFCMKLLFLIFATSHPALLSTRPENLSKAKAEIISYYEGGQYDKDLCKAINKAIKHFNRVSVSPKTVVIFDVDDTVLQNYQLYKKISFGHVPEIFYTWIVESDTPAIPQTKFLYDYLVDRGFHIIFLSGRRHDEYDLTVENLKKQGFTTFDRVIVRSEKDARKTAHDFKVEQRKLLTQEGYNIVAMVGDQWSDVCGGYADYYVKLPNLMYTLE